MSRGDSPLRRSSRWALTLLLPSCIFVAFTPVLVARSERLNLRHQSLELPGPPASVVPADLDGDGREDLLVVVVYTEWGQTGRDRIEGLIQVVEVVPALFDRREVYAFLSGEDGSYRSAGMPLPLPSSVLSVEAGPPGLPAIALTDEGVASLTLSRKPDGPALNLTPLLSDPVVLAGTQTFLPGLSLVQDLDGDGTPDLMLPAREGLAIYRGTGTGLSETPTTRLALPGDTRWSGAGASRYYPLPSVQDLDGDGLPDLLVRERDHLAQRQVLRGAGGGHFHPARKLSWDHETAGSKPSIIEKKPDDGKSEESAPELAFLGDLDGDGAAELVTVRELDTGKSGLKQAKRPRYLYRFHRVNEDLVPEAEPYSELEAIGYPFGVDARLSGGGGLPIFSPDRAFRDLDGDGRRDLVTITLDFSWLQIVRVLATKRLSIGLDFHIYAQGEDGRFRQVHGLDLSEKLRLKLKNLRLGRFAHFAGDFDGDGRADFVHLGRGKTITIHRGEPGCHYPKKPDLSIVLDEEPRNPLLVRIEDLDGDDRSDLAITRPLPAEESGPSAPVLLDLYLSGGAP